MSYTLWGTTFTSTVYQLPHCWQGDHLSCSSFGFLWMAVGSLIVTFVPSLFNCAVVALLALHISMTLSKDKLGSLSNLALVLSHIMPQTI